MSRLQKKCFIVSTGTHFLLVVILFVGPAFLSSKNKSEDLQALDFLPSMLIDANLAGGGSKAAKQPSVTPPVAQAPPQAPPPTPEKQPAPDPPKQTIKEQKADPESLEATTEPKKKTPQVSTKLVTRNNNQPAKPRKTSTPDIDAEERQQTSARQELAKQFTRAAGSIRSSATTIEDSGPGGGGPSYANYAAFVMTAYKNAWEPPEDTASDDAVAKVSVTIARDGNVLSAEITRPSGDSYVDRSVERTLQRVKFIAPFPEGAKDKQRTYIINFNLKMKRARA